MHVFGVRIAICLTVTRYVSAIEFIIPLSCTTSSSKMDVLYPFGRGFDEEALKGKGDLNHRTSP